MKGPHDLCGFPGYRRIFAALFLEPCLWLLPLLLAFAGHFSEPRSHCPAGGPPLGFFMLVDSGLVVSENVLDALMKPCESFPLILSLKILCYHSYCLKWYLHLDKSLKRHMLSRWTPLLCEVMFER